MPPRTLKLEVGLADDFGDLTFTLLAAVVRAFITLAHWAGDFGVVVAGFAVPSICRHSVAVLL